MNYQQLNENRKYLHVNNQQYVDTEAEAGHKI